MNKDNITITDIAKVAGVSKTTVSRYLNGRFDLMSEETMNRIKSVVEMTGYCPNPVARSLKTRQNNQIGVLIADISSPFSASLISGISNVLSENGYDPLFVGCNDNAEKEQRYIEMFLSKKISGLIVNAVSSENPLLIKACCDNIPVVLCDRYINNYNFSIVTEDQFSIMEQLVMHIKKQGFNRPVLFTQQWENNSSRINRKNAFVEIAQKAFGYAPADDVYVIDNGIMSELERLLNSIKPDDRVAIICSNSKTTVKTYNALKERNIRIPEQIGLCGTEDWNWESDMNWPQLLTPAVTTVSIPTMEMGMKASELMLQKIKDNSMAEKEILLPCKLIQRESTLI